MAEERIRRRLAAILAADVVGYSRMMEADEPGTLSRLQTLRRDLLHPKAVAYGGRIVKTTGDGTLVEFPSAVDAVSHALDVQAEIGRRNADTASDRRIQIRMGINVGDIIVEDDDIFGDGVNVAARLEALANPGGICISGTVFDQVKTKLDLAYEDMGPQSVKNIAEPVRVYRLDVGADADAGPVADAAPAAPDRPSLAVLPFANISGDPEQEYFADGMTEDLITDLSKISGLFVIARNSSFTFKGQSVDVVAAGRKLGVTRVLEGSVRRAGGQIRINAQLIDATTGGHLWAERYDGAFENIFALQDEITAKIVAALEVTLTPTDKARVERRPTASLEAYDLYLKARERYYRYSPDAVRAAVELLERAIGRDPEFADAWAYLSGCHVGPYVMRWPGAWGSLEEARAAAEKAVALDPESPIGQSRLGWVYSWMRRDEEAEACFERAATLAPDLAEVFVYHAVHYLRTCRFENALRLIDKAATIDPFAPLSDYHRGIGLLFLGRHDEAVARLESARERTPSHTSVRLHLASAYVEKDRIDAAAREVSKALEIAPEYTVALADEIFWYRDVGVRRRFAETLRLAGLPEA